MRVTELILQLLALIIRERSGREIATEFEARFKKPISFGTLYTTLTKMEEERWLSVREDADQDGRLRHYRITGEGRQVLEEAVAARQAVNDGLRDLGLARAIP